MRTQIQKVILYSITGFKHWFHRFLIYKTKLINELLFKEKMDLKKKRKISTTYGKLFLSSQVKFS